MGSACTWSVRGFCGPRLRATMASSSSRASKPHGRRRRSRHRPSRSSKSSVPVAQVQMISSSEMGKHMCLLDMCFPHTRFEKFSKSSNSDGDDVGCVGGRLSRRRRPDERIDFVALSGGAHLPSPPDTTTRDLCLILSRVDACRLPATRAQDLREASLARRPLAASSTRVRAANHEGRALSPRCARPIASRDERASPHPPAALPAPVERDAAASGSQATAVRRVTRRNRTHLLSRTTARLANGSVRHHDGVASLVGSLPDATPCRPTLDGLWAAHRLRAPPSALRSAHSIPPGNGKRAGDALQSPACAGARACPACPPA